MSQESLTRPIPSRWRKKLAIWLVTLAASQAVESLWGPGVLLVALLLVSIAGALFRSLGFRGARRAEALLGSVWDYFREAILVALLPALWPAVQALRDGDTVSGLAQLAVLGLIAAIVIVQFRKLPRTWTAVSRRGPGRRRHRKG